MINNIKILYVGTIFYCVVSLLLIYFHDGYLIDDAVIYWSQAIKSPGLVYPSATDFTSDFIWHPMVINVSRFILWLGGGLKTVQLLNVLLSLGILHGIRKLAFTLFSFEVSLLTFVLCLIYPNFYVWNLAPCTEIYFLFFLVLILNMFNWKNEYRYFFIGLLFPVLDYSRELGLIVLVCFLLGNVTEIVSKSGILKKLKHLVLFIFGFSLIHFGIGKFHEIKTGIFWTKGSVLGYNIINGAAGDHVGENNNLATQKGSLGYIPNASTTSFYAKDSIWRKRGFDFIRESPFEYLKPFPRKLVKLFIHDLAFVNFAYEKYSWYQMAKDRRKGKSIVGLLLDYPFLWLMNVWFYILFVCELIGIWLFRFKFKSYLFIVLLGSSMLFLPMLFQTQPRYHAPTFILFLPFAGAFIYTKLEKWPWFSKLVGN